MSDEEPTGPDISTAAIELLALWASMQLEPMFELIAETLRALAAERDAQAAEIERLEKACAEWAEVSQSNYHRAKAAEAKLAKAVEALEGESHE